jgi:phosphate transport system protein
MRHHFIEELEALRNNFLSMGDLTLESVANAIKCIRKMDGTTFDHAKQIEARINASNRLVYDQALRILTLQAPVASDARFIAGIIESIVDLEEIGDYALDVCEMALAAVRKANAQAVAEVADLAERSRGTLVLALEAWRQVDPGKGRSVRAQEASIRSDANTLTEKLYKLTQLPGDTSIYVDLVLICRYLVRVVRHAVAIGEQAAAAVPTGQ